MTEPGLRVLSLGAGVQSTTLALLAAHGEVGPMPDGAIFADTHSEPAAVYRHLDWLESKLPFPVHRVSAGSLRENIVNGTVGQWVSTPPFFTLKRPVKEHLAGCTGAGTVTCPDCRGAVSHGEDPDYLEEGDPWCGSCHAFGFIICEACRPDTRNGVLRRQCTLDFKIRPIRRKVRQLLGAPRLGRVPTHLHAEQWIGISLDEVQRMKPSRDAWVTHRWPLVDLRMSRGDCLAWMDRHGYQRPPRSACTFCPYHSNEEWRRVREQPEEWEQVVALDRLIREGVKGTTDRLFLHRDLKPIDEVDLSTPEDHGQLRMFDNECEGMCGV